MSIGAFLILGGLCLPSLWAVLRRPALRTTVSQEFQWILDIDPKRAFSGFAAAFILGTALFAWLAASRLVSLGQDSKASASDHETDAPISAIYGRWVRAGNLDAASDPCTTMPTYTFAEGAETLWTGSALVRRAVEIGRPLVPSTLTKVHYAVHGRIIFMESHAPSLVELNINPHQLRAFRVASPSELVVEDIFRPNGEAYTLMDTGEPPSLAEAMVTDSSHKLMRCP